MLAYLMYNIQITMGHNTILVHIVHVTYCFGLHCIFIHSAYSAGFYLEKLMSNVSFSF